MTKVVNIQHKQQILEAAGSWLARLERGLSEQEKQEIGSWLAEDRVHGQALMEISSLWDDMTTLEELAELFPLPEKPQVNQQVRWGFPKPAVYVFSSLFLFVISSLFVLNTGVLDTVFNKRFAIGPVEAEKQQAIVSTQTDNNAQGMQARYETAIGEQSEVTLPDGSRVTLNTGTRIQFHYTDSERRIVLETGESYFEVAKDKQRPFKVYVNNNIVQAVGTAFNVDYSHTSNLEVTVTEGEVKVVSPPKLKQIFSGSLKEESFLKGGQRAVLAKTEDHKLQKISASEINKNLAWKEGMVIFDREPLKDALAELSRYTLTEFVLADKSMESILVGGYFKSGDVYGLLQALKENFNIDATKSKAGKIILTAQL